MPKLDKILRWEKIMPLNFGLTYAKEKMCGKKVLSFTVVNKYN